MGLFSIFGNKEKIVPGQRMDRLDANGDIPYGWHYANRATIGKLEGEHFYFTNEYYGAKRTGKGVLAEYAALKSLIQHMEYTRKLCISMGECFEKWSLDSVADPVRLNELKTDLAQMEANMDALLKKEKAVKQLKSDLLRIIKEEPGVVQADLYKRFDSQLKGEISNQLYLLSASGTVIREKSGRSYKLYIK